MSDRAPIAVRANPPAQLETPPAHLELSWRPLGRADAPALFTLVQAIETVDKPPQRHSFTTVEQMFVGEWKDLERDTLGGFDAAGTLRAYGVVEVSPGDERTVRAFLVGGVHPQWRGRGLGRALLTWTEGRGRQKLAESGKELPARLAVHVDEKARDQRRLYAAAGFSPIRWYTTMRRDLRAPIPRVDLPDGVRIVPWSAELDEQIRLAHNETFVDHWGSEPLTAEHWSQHSEHFAPAWSFAAVDSASGTDEVAGYTISGRYEQDWPVLGYTFGYTDLLGVRSRWRGQRLSVALLTAAMQAFRADGLEYAGLDVDADNPSGAHGLYARLGYEPTHGEILYSVEL